MQSNMHRSVRLLLLPLLAIAFSASLLFAQDEEVSIPQELMNMSVSQLFQEGNSLLDEGNYTEARPYFLAVVEKDSTQAGAYARLGEVAYQLFDLNAAQKYLRQAIEADPKNEEYRVRFNAISELIKQFKEGVEEMDRRNYAEAEKIFNAVLEQFPGFAPAHYRLGFVYSAQDKTGEAVESFQRAIEEDPDNENYKKALVYL